MRRLYDKYLPNWEYEPEKFKDVPNVLPTDELVEARKAEKKEFVHWINSNENFLPINNVEDDDYFREYVLTIGFARRFVPYKRPDLIFRDLNALRDVGFRKLQIVFAGKCHSDDMYCNKLKEAIEQYGRELRGQIRIAIIPTYNLDVAKRMVAGTDVWLNNPIPSREASGTSGMKAALNGGLNLSAADGWWIEGADMVPDSGWMFAKRLTETDWSQRDDQDSKELLTNLGDVIDCYYKRSDQWALRMKRSISLLSFFNTHRLIREYEDKIWGRQQ
jgi:starch phosphorylase